MKTQDQVHKAELTIYFCPSRRSIAKLGDCVLMDYASAEPLTANVSYWHGPLSDPQKYTWVLAPNETYNGVLVRTDWNIWVTPPAVPSFSGSSKPCRVGEIKDGLSNTFVIGEKRLQPNQYQSGAWHDDRGWSDGYDPDTVRYTGTTFAPDTNTGVSGYEFGGPHAGAMNAVWADGSVRPIGYSIDPQVFNDIADRRDGNVVNAAKIN
jgi:prepilin-type processing-associated H-X9-DG protein